ncbi:hypothetical protein P7K49_025498 [Saguinus oedipus]|uniref:Dedicator of cytokinesis N-terminal domain-containing protein n=1 Tax=Saguinus oedipus TaxID=9490 RepID=A0ABQ9UHC2_SAGOE|nr:hypothetical protein P7K49_025498 [Saguinus oedipus]
MGFPKPLINRNDIAPSLCGELRKDIYITVHIIRIGRMGAGEKKNACSVQYRRPFGCAVLSIADLLTGETKDDLILKVYMCNTESEWYQIHENIIKKLNARYNLTGSNAGPRNTCFADYGWLRAATLTNIQVHRLKVAKKEGDADCSGMSRKTYTKLTRKEKNHCRQSFVVQLNKSHKYLQLTHTAVLQTVMSASLKLRQTQP